MPKQVEVRMHESHLEPIEARPQSKCALICSKMFKNLLLTLTVLGKPPHAVFFSFNYFLLLLLLLCFVFISREKNKKQGGLNTDTNYHWVQSYASSIICAEEMPSVLRQKDDWVFWTFPILCHLLLSKAVLYWTYKQPLVMHEKCCHLTTGWLGSKEKKFLIKEEM